VSANGGTVSREGPVVEAFPNAFLGVLMPEGELALAPKTEGRTTVLTGFVNGWLRPVD
jgi:hypothetical protein